MLTTYLKATPPSKLVLINDCLQERALPLVYYLNEHHQKLKNPVKYFVFEGNFVKIDIALGLRNIKSFNCTRIIDDVEDVFKEQLKDNCVIVIDSVVHMIYLYGLVRTCKLLNSLLQAMNDGQQIIAVLHMDLLTNSKKTAQFLEYIATLNLTFIPYISQVSYTYKKIGGRVFKKTESYKFENGEFITDEIKKPEIGEIVQEKITEVCPENLTTFKIGLSDAEKESRDKLILPYLPKDSDADEDIVYHFDNEDNWDEEDPDDDLDL